MPRDAKKPSAARVKYPIGFKLVAIITILLLVSLGAITALVSVMVSSDLRVTAEENNFSVNKRSASEAETTLATVRSSVLVLLDTLNAVGSSQAALSRQAAAFFFERNQDIAAIVITGDRELVNNRFFLANELESDLVGEFMARQREAVDRSRSGETLLLNAAPIFHIPLLALLFPWQETGSEEVVLILFSSDSLNDNFGQGVNSSYMINDAGDILVHPDYELVRAGANAANQPFVEALRESQERNLQTLYTDRDGGRYFGAFQKLSVANAVVITNVEYNVVFEGIAATTRRNIYLTGAVLFVSIILIWLFSKTISRPLKGLTVVAGQIEEGLFEQNLVSKSRDELGVLTQSFSRMSKALGIFGRFTNREIALGAMRGEIKPGGQPKHGTVFFSDIRNFTSISEEFARHYGDESSDRIVAWLNEYLTRMVDCVEKTNGVVDKFIGDSVMAHWGTAYTSGSPEADALNGVRAALMMREALYQMNKDRGENDPANPRIRIGCGINSGVVTAGQIGSEQRMEYTVIGDAVNLASRTEALNKPLGTDILITEDTWNLVGKHLITEEMPSVEVKGKSKPVRMFAVVNFKEDMAIEGQLQPQTLAELRDMLGIIPPDLSKVNTNAEEKKYKIGSGE
ncbi:adenylate/guanylate cyclase domain-containing protein [Treponema primitia]|uniref:adenylate/guanylate cyclase domain-containing protein n=1 Tax=Treponema primitia TaxID=88058 RepID=UPI0002554CD1|nr:adenylate/guanylate cyclase domain-containing protein [Treponema primitia]